MDKIAANIPPLVERIGQLLVARGWTLSTAESCTGGLIGHLLTNLSGSSAFFQGGIISYANAAKQSLLGVPAALLETHGAVSGEVALAMAQGARRALGTEVAVATTGIAGPLGGTPTKPVGTVYVALSCPAVEVARHHLWHGGREQNKLASALAALELLLEAL
jgi:PncC family amidohydrolase